MAVAIAFSASTSRGGVVTSILTFAVVTSREPKPSGVVPTHATQPLPPRAALASYMRQTAA
jgi:hypothetical protein